MWRRSGRWCCGIDSCRLTLLGCVVEPLARQLIQVRALAPAGECLFFARPKKSHQKNGRPTEWVSNSETALRYSPAPGVADRTSMSCLRQARFPAGPLRADPAPAALLGHSDGAHSRRKKSKNTSLL